MLKTKLAPCANTLYHWVQIHIALQQTQPFEMETLQAWLTEFLDRPVTALEIEEAFRQLSDLNLIKVEQNYITRMGTISLRQLSPLPTIFLTYQGQDKHWLWFILFCGSFLIIHLSSGLYFSHLKPWDTPIVSPSPVQIREGVPLNRN